MPNPEKVSGYARRNRPSEPAPIEIDSDSDFNPGAYIPESVKKRKKGSSGPSTSSAARSKRGKRAITTGGSSVKRLRTEESLDLRSESEESNDEPDERRDEREDEDEDEDSEGSDEDSGDSVSHKKIFIPTNRERKTPPNFQAPSSDFGVGNVEDSVTESDSEVDNGMLIPQRTSAVTTPQLEDSVTEPESDMEEQLLAAPLISAYVSSGSETESDPEYELDDPVSVVTFDATISHRRQRLKPRPGFPLRDGQAFRGPLYLDSDKKIAVPASINTYLRDYQRDGVRFFYKQYSEGRGGLLGDDMGLKKGVMTDKNRRKKHVSRLQDGEAWKKRRELPPADATWPTCLIIAPSTVVHNWQREFQTDSLQWGYFEIGMYNGSQKEREPVLNDFKMGRIDVVLTTFDVARRDIDVLDSLPWTTIFVDEVHRVKNVNSKIAMAYHQFGCERRFGLTGTTIQNSYKEMWTILDWTNPGRVGNARQWNGFIVKPLTLGQSAGATEDERAKALLPMKTDQVVFCPLTSQQIAVYKQILNMDPVQNMINRNHLCSCGSGKRSFVRSGLRPPTDSPEQIIRNRALAELAFPDGDAPKYGTAMMQPKFCGKWTVLEMLLKEWRKDSTNKVLIFTKSVKLLEMLDFHLKSKGHGFLKLDGATKQSDRMPMIDQFHSDPDVFIFLISTLAGGTGLNLTGANKVCPNLLERAFRFGQTRDVSVYRLLGAGSVEELIYARQIYKQQQMAIAYEASVQTRYFEGVQGDTGKKGELFGIENIFKLHEDKLATKMAIEKANLAELDWALANMGGLKSKKQVKPNNENWLVDAEPKGKDRDDLGNMRGLGALLFDDALPTTDNSEQDSIHRTLSAIGVKYSHHNDQIIAPSRIEEERTKKTLLTRRRRKSKPAKANSPEKRSPKPQWPPIRKHHKVPLQLTPEQQLESRHKALVELGMINHPGDVPNFARDFARQPPEMQMKILEELDNWARTRERDSDSD
ncbi:hypothetical protein H0H93_001690 [Arthromyces matolae]|nr:hypothetical protein H0H93_001690 [Arthromyces matolae]